MAGNSISVKDNSAVPVVDFNDDTDALLALRSGSLVRPRGNTLVPRDGSVSLEKLSSGTAGTVLGYDESGSPVEKSVGDPENAQSIATTSSASDLINGRLATAAEAKAGTDDAKLMAPARVKDAIGRGGIPVGLLDSSRPDDLMAIIARYGLTPFDGGAEGQGYSGDDAPGWNEAAARIRTGGGGSLIIPPTRSAGGRWRLNSSIQLHSLTDSTAYLNVIGLGNKAVVERFGTTGDTFVCGDSSHSAYYVQVKNIHLINQAGKTSGHDFKFTNASLCEIGNIVTDGTYSGFWGENLNSFYGRDIIQFNMPNQTTGNGVTIYSDPATSGRTDIVKFDELTIQARNAGSGGMLINGRVNGVHTDGLYTLGVSRGLQLTSSGSTWSDAPQFCFFLKFEVDRATDIGCVIDKAYRTEFVRCDISNTSGAEDEPYPQGSADTQALLILQNAIDTRFVGGRIGNCREQAVYDDGRGTTFLGTTLMDMSKGGSHAAIYTGPHAQGFAYVGLLIDGFSRASYAHQIETTAKDGTIFGTRYQNVVSGYSAGAGSNVSNTEQVLTSYDYSY